MSHTKTVLVAGATGAQGGSVVNALLEKGHRIVAMTRNPDSSTAIALKDRGVDLRSGDFTNPDSLRTAAEGIDAAFMLTTPFETGPNSEIAQGKAMVDALRAANVGHVVFSSVGSADKATGVPHFDSKYEVEKYLASSGLPYSIIGPVYFMDNLLSPWGLPALQQGSIAAALPEDRPLQQVAVKNIGEFAAALIGRGASVFGKRYDIAGDELTMADAVKKVSEACGRQIAFHGFPVEALKEQSEDLALMFDWFNKVGYSADVAALKAEFPEVNWLTYGDWLAQQDWSILEQPPAA